MKLDINLHELLEMETIFKEKKRKIKKDHNTATEKQKSLIDTNELETIERLLVKLDVLFKKY